MKKRTRSWNALILGANALFVSVIGCMGLCFPGACGCAMPWAQKHYIIGDIGFYGGYAALFVAIASMIAAAVFAMLDRNKTRSPKVVGD